MQLIIIIFFITLQPSCLCNIRVNIPAYVRKEILHKDDIASDKLKALLRSNSVVEVDARNFRMVDALCRKLGRGESEAIVVAIEHSVRLILLFWMIM